MLFFSRPSYAGENESSGGSVMWPHWFTFTEPWPLALIVWSHGGNAAKNKEPQVLSLKSSSPSNPWTHFCLHVIREGQGSSWGQTLSTAPENENKSCEKLCSHRFLRKKFYIVDNIGNSTRKNVNDSFEKNQMLMEIGYCLGWIYFEQEKWDHHFSSYHLFA